MPIRAVIFDFGGVLVRTLEDGGRRKWERVLGLRPGDADRFVFDSEVARRATLGQVTVDEHWQQVGSHLSLSPEKLAQFQRDFWSGDRLDTQLMDFIAELRSEYKTGLLSNAWSNARSLFTERFSLGEHFDEMVISAEEGLAKPDPRIYHLASQRLGVKPEEAIFVDDMPANVKGAQLVGMHGIRFETTGQTITRIESVLSGQI